MSDKPHARSYDLTDPKDVVRYELDDNSAAVMSVSVTTDGEIVLDFGERRTVEMGLEEAGVLREALDRVIAFHKKNYPCPPS